MEALSKTLDAAVYPQTFDEFSTHFSDEDAVSCGEYSVETYWSTDILPTIVEETEEEALSVMTPCRPCERLDTQKEDESVQYEEEICSFLSEDDYTYVTYVTGDEISVDSNFLHHSFEGETEFPSSPLDDSECPSIVKESIDYEKMQRKLAFEICRSRAKNDIEEGFKLSFQAHDFTVSTSSSTGHDEKNNQWMKLALERYGGLRRRISYEQSKAFLQQAFGGRKNKISDTFSLKRATDSDPESFEISTRQEVFQKSIEKFRQKFEKEVKPLLTLNSEACSRASEKTETCTSLRETETCYSSERTKMRDNALHEGSEIDLKLSRCRITGRIAQERLKSALQEYQLSSIESNEDAEKSLPVDPSLGKIMNNLEESPNLRLDSEMPNPSQKKLLDAFQSDILL